MKDILKNIGIGQIIGIYHFEENCFTVGKILKITNKYLFLLSYDINLKKDGIKIFLINSIKRIVLKSDYIQNLKVNERKNFLFKEKDLFQELIKNKLKISVELVDGTIENAYLIEKQKSFLKLNILDDNENISSEEIIEEDYLKSIKLHNFIEKEEYKKFKIITTIDGNEYMAYDLFYNGNYIIFSEKTEFYDVSKINVILKNRIQEISKIEVKLDIQEEDFCKLINLEEELEISKILKICFENKFLVFVDNEDFYETKVGIITELKKEKLKIKEIDKYGNYNKISEIYLDEIEIMTIKNYKL